MFPDKNLKKISPGVPELWSDKQTNKHPNRDYNYIYIDVDIHNFHENEVYFEPGKVKLRRVGL